MAKISLDRFQLQFISHQNEKISYLDGIHEAITGLCGWVQLRMKDASVSLLPTWSPLVTSTNR